PRGEARRRLRGPGGARIRGLCRLPGRRLDGGPAERRRIGDDGAFLRVLGDHLAPLLLAPPLLAALVIGIDAAPRAVADRAEHGGEKAAERELRGDDDRQKNRREDDNQRAGAIEVFGELAGEEFTGVAAGAKRLAGDL